MKFSTMASSEKYDIECELRCINTFCRIKFFKIISYVTDEKVKNTNVTQ